MATQKGVKPPLRLEYIDPDQLEDNPANWRLHPPKQLNALNEALSDPNIGWAGALLYNEKTKRLIDGHARKQLFAGRGEPIPVLVGSWSEEAERTILATLDPISKLAEPNADALEGLIDSLNPGPSIALMLIELAQDTGISPLPAAMNPDEHWGGMPIYDQPDSTSWRQIIVHFENQHDLDKFAQLVHQTFTDKTKSIWFPYHANEPTKDMER